ncbi:hypothetical protein JOB18_024678 [Solea senegalensis]|uniref:Uncharacterized protein n=1 Tax=Solea senegalensis TaxID=28829 RepID=A0AAV6SK88_SOLSE|nr:hypothetical protein JOB18_024678 [Solea senegalensis]
MQQQQQQQQQRPVWLLIDEKPLERLDVWDGAAPCGSHSDLERQRTWKVRPHGSGYPSAALGNLTCRGGPRCLPRTGRHMCCVRSHYVKHGRITSTPQIQASCIQRSPQITEKIKEG